MIGSIIFYALLVLSLSVMVWGLWGLYRNGVVYRARVAMLNAISDAAKVDIRERSAFHWRYDFFDTVSYQQMLRSWRNPRDMYENLDFIDPNVRRGNLFDEELRLRSESELLDGDS